MIIYVDWETNRFHFLWHRYHKILTSQGLHPSESIFQMVSLRTQTYFRLSLVSAENNVCEPEAGNDFCDIGILSRSQFSSSSPRTTARGIRCEEHSSFILSWNLIGLHRNRFLTRVRRRYFRRRQVTAGNMSAFAGYQMVGHFFYF